MKKSFTLLSGSFILLLSLSVLSTNAQSVAVNEDGAQPNPSPILAVQSTTKGLLIPRMNSIQRNEIAPPTPPPPARQFQAKANSALHAIGESRT